MEALHAQFNDWAATTGEQLIHWARPSGWAASPAQVSISVCPFVMLIINYSLKKVFLIFFCRTGL